MKRVIGEKINTAYKVFVVALPESKDDYIRVSTNPVLIADGTFYYDDNTAEIFYADAKIKEILNPEYAKIHIPWYAGEKLMLVNAFCNIHTSYCFSSDDERKANKKLHDKLSGLTKYEFYNSKW